MKHFLSFLFIILFSVTFGFANNGEKITKKVDVESSSISWLGKKVTGKHFGSVSIQSGELIMEDGVLTGGSFVIDMSSITVEDIQGTYADKLLGHLKSDDFFGVDNFKTAQLVFTNVVSDNGIYTITGDLTIKGKTAPITFDASMNEDGASAEIVVDRTIYDIRYGSGKFFDNLGDKAIYDDFTLTVNLAL